MKINEIRYTCFYEEEVHLKLEKTARTLHQFVCFNGTSHEIDTLGKALAYCLTGAPKTLFKHTALSLIDGSGQSWIIDRHQSRITVLCNQKPVKGGLSLDILNLIFDLELDPTRLLSPQHFIRLFALGEKRGEIYAELSPQLLSHEATEAESKTTLLKNELKGRINASMPSLAPLTLKEINSLLTQLEPCYFQWEEIQREIKILRNMSQNIARIEPNYIADLKKQISLISKIEELSKETLLPANSIDTLTKQYRDTNIELKEMCSEFGLAALPSVSKSIPWHRVLTLVCRLRLSGYLAEASELALKKMKLSVEPVLQGYHETVASFLRNDHHITQELQKSLELLTNYVNQIPSPLVHRERFLGQLHSMKLYFHKIFKGAPPAAQLEKGEETLIKASLTSDPHNHPVSLDRVRTSVDDALGCLGELHANLNSSHNSYVEAVNLIESCHEKIIQEHSRLKYSWQQMVTTYRLPDNCEVKTILQLIGNQGKLLELLEIKEQIKQKIFAQRKRLKHLEKLVIHWRTLSKSVKESSLENPHVLLSETKAILEYTHKKRSQFSKLEKMQIQYYTQTKITQVFQSRLKSIKQMWHKSFQDHNIQTIELNQEFWPQVFKNNNLLKFLIDQTDPGEREELGGVEIFHHNMAEKPLTFFHLCPPRFPISAGPLFLKYLKEAPFSGLGILMVSHPDILESLTLLGIARFQKTKKAPAPKKEAAEQRPNSILSDRAERAMKIFSIQTDQNKNF